jgi:DNA repair exonuclease SbcCD ATPase subunit
MACLLSDFGKGWDIKVRSQKATKSGTLQEAIDIMVDSGYGERDIGTYSGGEKKILKSIVRIAFATLQAERTGKGLKVLVLDEATDHMDDENAEITIRMLGRLKCFNQVIVISHHTRVLGEIINKIRLGTP